MSTGNNILDVKNHNRAAILQCLLDAPFSRSELARALHLSSMTVTNLVRDLVEEGWIGDVPLSAENQRSVGRPPTQLQLNRSAGYAIGAYIGVGSLQVGLVDLVGGPLAMTEQAFSLKQSAMETLAQLSGAICDLLAARQVDQASLLGVGVGASGLVDSEAGINVVAPSLGWRAVPIGPWLSKQLDMPVFVENNARAMALAEAHFGAGRAVDSLAFVFGRIGIGAGFVMQRKLVRGIAAGAGEIGHTIIQSTDGQPCSCGQIGCLEPLVNQHALLGTSASPEDVARFFERVRTGDRAASASLAQLTDYLAIALINLVNTLNPERIVLGGLYAQGAEWLIPTLTDAVRARAFGGLGHCVSIAPTSFGDNVGVVGAAALALINNFYERPRRAHAEKTTNPYSHTTESTSVKQLLSKEIP